MILTYYTAHYTAHFLSFSALELHPCRKSCFAENYAWMMHVREIIIMVNHANDSLIFQTRKNMMNYYMVLWFFFKYFIFRQVPLGQWRLVYLPQRGSPPSPQRRIPAQGRRMDTPPPVDHLIRLRPIKRLD